MKLIGTVVNAGDNGDGGFYVEIDTETNRGSLVFDVDENQKNQFPEGQKVKVVIEALGTGD